MSKKMQQFLNSTSDKRTARALMGAYEIEHPTPSAVTQLTNRTTAVTVSTLAGTITTNNASLAAEAAASFTVNCAAVAIGDVVNVCQQGGAVGVMTTVAVIAVANGSFNIAVMNGNPAAGTAETGAIIINYAVTKSRASP